MNVTGVSDVTFWTSRRLKEDNLFASMFRSKTEDYKLIYLGDNYMCIKDLLEEKLLDKFEDIQTIEEVVCDDCSKEMPHAIFFDGQEWLQQSVDKNASLLAYTMMYDTNMHYYGYEHPKVKGLLHQMNEQMKGLKSFIDQHPEYLLIIGQAGTLYP